jgi:hypothetical protein
MYVIPAFVHMTDISKNANITDHNIMDTPKSKSSTPTRMGFFIRSHGNHCHCYDGMVCIEMFYELYSSLLFHYRIRDIESPLAICV